MFLSILRPFLAYHILSMGTFFMLTMIIDYSSLRSDINKYLQPEKSQAAIKNNLYDGTNPCMGLKKYKINSRDRFLNIEELKLFFEAIELETQLFQDFFSLLLYTGARKSNVLYMKWVDIDFNLKPGESRNINRRTKT